MLSNKIALIKMIEEIKSHSSKWIKAKGVGYQSFVWQDGYRAFSVKPYEIENVIAYITNQQDHHSKKRFRDVCLSYQFAKAIELI